MRINNQTCTRCVNDKTIKNVSFNKEGVCSFCQTYDQYQARLNDKAALEKLFFDKLNVPGNFDYDVALGFSGGKDSTYVLYKLVKDYKLKVKAYTLDNGFMSPEAKNKINSIVKELKVEHEFIVTDQELLKRTYKSIVSKYLSPCIACAFLGYAAMINYASKVNAKVGMHGRSPYQMLRGLSEGSDDVFAPFIEAGLEENKVDLDKLYSSVIEKIDLLVDYSLANGIKNILLLDTKKNGYRDFIAYFLYHDYNQKEIIDVLEANTSWKVESEEEHFDCLIHHGALYLKNLVARRSHLMSEYSVMIRAGVLSREAALKKMQEKIDSKLAREELKALCRYADVSYHGIMLKAYIYSKRWW